MSGGLRSKQRRKSRLGIVSNRMLPTFTVSGCYSGCTVSSGRISFTLGLKVNASQERTLTLVVCIYICSSTVWGNVTLESFVQTAALWSGGIKTWVCGSSYKGKNQNISVSWQEQTPSWRFETEPESKATQADRRRTQWREELLGLGFI